MASKPCHVQLGDAMYAICLVHITLRNAFAHAVLLILLVNAGAEALQYIVSDLQDMVPCCKVQHPLLQSKQYLHSMTFGIAMDMQNW